MAVGCLVCKQYFDVPLHVGEREVLVSCPACGFLGRWSKGSLVIPTHQEESSLDRVNGSIATPESSADIAADDATIVDATAGTLPLPYKRRLYFEIQNGSHAGTSFVPQTGRIIIGRQDADIVVDGANVSRKHAVIEAISRENIFIRDLASTNGTYLNGVEVRSKKLRSGDVIRIGATDILFAWEDEN